MRRVVALVLVAAAVLVTTAAGSGYGSPSTPVLRIADAAPLTLQGTGFGAFERVQLTVRSSSASRTRIVFASRLGRFAAVFNGVEVRNPCELEARARGGRGSVAALRLPARMCQID